MRFPFSHSISVYDHERVYHFTGIALLDWQKHLPSSAFRDKHTYSQTFAVACSVLFFSCLYLHLVSCFKKHQAFLSSDALANKSRPYVCPCLSLSLSFSLAWIVFHKIVLLDCLLSKSLEASE